MICRQKTQYSTTFSQYCCIRLHHHISPQLHSMIGVSTDQYALFLLHIDYSTMAHSYLYLAITFLLHDSTILTLCLLGNFWFFSSSAVVCLFDLILYVPSTIFQLNRECSGSVVECLTRDRRVAGSSLTGVTALWSLSKTHLS